MYKDCFALAEVQCGVLKKMMCKEGVCPFYKSKKRFKEEQQIYPHQNDIQKRKGGKR